MEKMVGSLRKRIVIFLLLLSNYMFASDAAIVLSMKDMNHKPISQAMCQAPFILQVELKNIESYTDVHLLQGITGLEYFKSSRSMTSRNVSIDNGKKTVKIFYNFVLRSDKKGKFTLGPVYLKDESGKNIKSNRLIVPVGDEVIASDSSQKNKYFMTISVNKKKVYVGEKITLRVKFYDRLFVDDLHLQFPDFTSLYMVKNKNVINKSMVLFEEEEYSLTEWVFDMYAQQAGSLIIQDIYAAFFAPELESKFKFGGSFDFFRSLHKSQQRITAQPIKIEVMPLPEHKDCKDVVAVGQFSKFTVAVSQNSVQVGQGIILSAELFGNGNFETMQPLSLRLPEGFKYYDSNMVTINEERTHKHSEFIVQASTAGTYKMQAQSLVYFDPIEEQYKTIESNALDDITITPSTELLESSQASENSIDELCVDGQCLQKELQDFCIIEKGSVHKKNNAAIPAGRFQQLIIGLLGAWLLAALHRSLFKKYFLQHPILHNYVIFSQATQAYNLALKMREVNKLYALFMQLFSDLIGNRHGQVDNAAIVQYLADRKFSLEEIQSWKKFYEQILQVSFSLKSHQQEVLLQEILFQQAFQWIQKLKDKA